jgi:hypothetical protein
MLIPPLLRFAGGLGVWAAYSQVLQAVVVGSISRRIAIISQTRPEGNTTVLHTLANDLPVTEKDISAAFPVYVWGSCSNNVPRQNSEGELITRKLGKNMILCTHNNEDGVDIYARQYNVHHVASLRELIASNRKGQIIAEPFQFHLWTCALKERVSAKHSPKISGTYWYAFRDYWNFEEAGALEIRWGSMKLLKLRSQRGRPSRLVVNDNRACTLTDFYVINGIVPMYIQWEGELNDETITWTRTSIRKGWKQWGKTIDRPPLAEK